MEKHDEEVITIFKYLKQLVASPPEERERIGFKTSKDKKSDSLKSQNQK